MGFVSASIAGAAVVGVPVMTALAAIWGWRFAFAAVGVVAVGVVVLTVRALPPTGHRRRRTWAYEKSCARTAHCWAIDRR